MSGDPRMSQDPEVLENLRRKWGLDQPVHIRYFNYIKGLLRGELGTSTRTSTDVSRLIGDRLASTFLLVFASFILAFTVGIILGFIAALNKNSYIDIFSMVFAIFGVSAPRFWVGLMLMYFFGVILQVLPTSGYGSFQQLILPSVTLSIPLIALLARITRSAVLDVINSDYIRTARSKGLSELVINYKHVLKNALISIITIAGLQLGSLVANTIIVEKVFSWPGLGSLIVDSIFRRDFPAVRGCVIIMCSTFIILNTIVDILYGVLDPRIKYS